MRFTFTPAAFHRHIPSESPGNCVLRTRRSLSSAHNYFFLHCVVSIQGLSGSRREREWWRCEVLGAQRGAHLPSLVAPTFCFSQTAPRETITPRILIQLLVNARGLLSSDTNTLASTFYSLVERSQNVITM
jgi:hypothetical protein